MASSQPGSQAGSRPTSARPCRPEGEDVPSSTAGPAKEVKEKPTGKQALMASVGCTPTIPAGLLSRDEIQRLFWRTNNFDELGDKTAYPNENLGDIHFIGQRDTKYFKFKASTAPFWSRNMTKYNEEFHQLPLDGATVNKLLYEINKPLNAPAGMAVPFPKDSKYRQDYQAYPGHKKTRMMRPHQQKHVSGEKSSETQCRTHEFYRGHAITEDPMRDNCKPVPQPIMKKAQLSTTTSYESCFDTNPRRMVPTKPDQSDRLPDNSNRVMGALIPNEFSRLMYTQRVFSASDLKKLPSMREVITGSSDKRPNSAARSTGKPKSSSVQDRLRLVRPRSASASVGRAPSECGSRGSRASRVP